MQQRSGAHYRQAKSEILDRAARQDHVRRRCVARFPEAAASSSRSRSRRGSIGTGSSARPPNGRSSGCDTTRRGCSRLRRGTAFRHPHTLGRRCPVVHGRAAADRRRRHGRHLSAPRRPRESDTVSAILGVDGGTGIQFRVHAVAASGVKPHVTFYGTDTYSRSRRRLHFRGK